MNRRDLLRGTLALTAASMVPACNSRTTRRGTIAETTLGRIRGQAIDDVVSFKGIPYGTDTAKTRFQKPLEAKNWTGVLDTNSYGAMAPQPQRPETSARKLISSWHIPQSMSEDCLVLNVWTPDLNLQARRPVLVWIHGGGFYSGSGASAVYDGANLARKGDVVVVTLNHRLNIFGYLYLGELDPIAYEDSGNIGQHDLLAALLWVQRNIERFGGNPDNVTLFGESGGGQKICCLLAMEAARGLFHKAAIQSGPYLQAASLHAAKAVGQAAMKRLGLARSQSQRIEQLTTAEIQSAYRKLPPSMFLGLGPIVDGRGLTRDPYSPDAPATSHNIPILIGFTRTETTYILGADRNFTLDRQGLVARIGEFSPDMDASALVSQYSEVMPEATPSELFFDITTHLIMGRDSALIADRHSAKAPAYFYHLAWSTPVDGGKWQSPHTLDVPLVFDNVQRAPSTVGHDSDGRAQALASLMSDAWLSFARTGTPATPQLPTWPTYTGSRREIMQLDEHCSVLTDPFQSRHALLSSIPAWNGRSGIG